MLPPLTHQVAPEGQRTLAGDKPVRPMSPANVPGPSGADFGRTCFHRLVAWLTRSSIQLQKFTAFSAVLLTFGAYALAEEPAFKQAVEPRTLVFPQDHASHSGFQTEWWYVTGNVRDAEGHDYGYQFTIFRRAMDPKTAQERGRTSAWAPTDFYLGHLAISDISGKAFYFEEDLLRGAAGLAGATDVAQLKDGAPIHVWLRDWEMLRTEHGWTLKAAKGAIALDLTLAETLQPVAHGRPGEEGLSHKGPLPGQASYYYSVPQLATTGTLTINSKTLTLKDGVSWMDHEFGSNQLSKDQAGWEWFAVEFDDGSALMLYILRKSDGSIVPESSGTWTSADGKSVHLPLNAFKAKPLNAWTSPHTGRNYTLGWRIELPGRETALEIHAAQDDQEVRSQKTAGISYYEGAIRVSGMISGKSVTGRGYLEITGAPGGKNGTEKADGLGGRL
jgi:predicted secreted hydrolase